MAVFLLRIFAMALMGQAAKGIFDVATSGVVGNWISNKEYNITRERAELILNKIRQLGLEHKLAEMPMHQLFLHDSAAYQLVLLLSPAVIVAPGGWDHRWGEVGEFVNYANTAHLPVGVLVKAVQGTMMVTIYRTDEKVITSVIDFSDMSLHLRQSNPM